MAASNTRRFTINGTSLLSFFRNGTYFNTCMAQILYTHLNSRGHGAVTRERRPQVSVTCTMLYYQLIHAAQRLLVLETLPASRPVTQNNRGRYGEQHGERYREQQVDESGICHAPIVSGDMDELEQ